MKPVDFVHFAKLEGYFFPGYSYGNVSHSPNTSDFEKNMNEIIHPYLPTRHSIKSKDGLLHGTQASRPEGVLASIDVENFFTNVSIDPPIEIILDQVYRNPSELAPSIPGETQVPAAYIQQRSSVPPH